MKEEFKQHPDLPGYVFSNTGVLIDTVDQYCVLERPANSSGYRWFYLQRIGVTVQTHRLMGELFVEGYGEKLIINHIDGDKENNAPTNLEWTSYGGNLVHAYITGLRTDTTPVCLINRITKQAVDFYSLNEAARFLEVNPEKLFRYLKSTRRAPFLKMWVVLYANEEIHAMLVRCTETYLNGSPKAVMVKLPCGLVEVYSSIAMVCRKFGLSKFKLGNLIKTGENYCDMSFAYVGDDFVGEIISDMVTPITPRRKPLQIKVTNRKTLETRYWESVEAFAKEHGSTKAAVGKSIYLKGGWRDFTIEYIRGPLGE